MKRGAGGTPGGIGLFVIGVIMALAGGYMLMNQIVVTNTFWGWHLPVFGQVSAFGITLIFFLIGVAILFFNYRNPFGWILTAGSLLVMLIGILANLQIYFAPATLFVTLGMLVLLVGGLALIVRALLPARQ
ncbi:MAG: hypothetical protein HDKAJFGB_01357 [Anaerolineae bacterium]|nr:hypothetical protein [Anaerolineae bacterium]